MQMHNATGNYSFLMRSSSQVQATGCDAVLCHCHLTLNLYPCVIKVQSVSQSLVTRAVSFASGGFFLKCKDFERMFDNSFPAKWRLGCAH